MAYVFNPFTGNLDSYGPILTGTGTVSAAADGTAALPGIAFASDTNTGIYRPGADQLAISTGGTGRLFVDANGNVTQQADSSDLIIKDTQSHTTSDGPLVQFQGRGPNGINYNFGFIRGVSSGINNAGILQFGTNNAGSQDERMRITSTGQIQSNGLGSAVSPALSFTTDTNTGIYSPGADQLAISTGGNGRLFVDANGNVGVGAVQNTSKFNVLTGTSNSTIMELTGASAGRGLKISTYANVANDAGVLIEAPWLNYGQLAFGTAGGERLRITSAGRVGIGTSSPSQKLHVKETNTNTIVGIIGSSSTASYISFEDNGTTAGNVRCGSFGNDFAIRTGGSESVRINSSGNVGIGTSSPSTPLEIRKDSNGAVVDSLKLTNFAGGANEGSAVLFESGGASGAKIIGARQGTSGHQLRFQTASTHTGAPVDRVTINSSGNVGIGTSSPTNYGAGVTSLSVNGSAGGVADFYFNGTRQGFIGTLGSNQMVIDTAGAAIPLTLKTNNNTALTIDQSQRVGIGTQSPAEVLHVAGNIRMNAVPGTDTNANLPVLFQTTTGTIDGGSSLTFNPASDYLSVNGLRLFNTTVSATGNLAILTCSNGSGQYDFRATNDSLRFISGSSEAARFDGSQRLLVGTSIARSNFFSGAPTLQIEGISTASSQASIICNTANANPPRLNLAKTRNNGTTSGMAAVIADDVLGVVAFSGADGTNFIRGASISAEVDGNPGTNNMPGRLVFSTTADGASIPTERMRIDNKGKISTFASAEFNYVIRNSEAAGTTYAFLYGLHSSTGTVAGGTNSFTVWNNGNVLNTNNIYAGISDIKLKENIVDANSQWDDLKALQVRKYNFKEGQTHTQLGLVAQEVELVSPGLVSESPDRDAEGNDLGTTTKSVNYSVLYMKAVKALQEAMERIETLEAKVAALESA